MNEQLLTRYNGVARALHWIIAIAIIAEITMGLGHDAMKDMFPVMPIHKATGITILALSLFRLVWRLTHKVPPLPATLPGWQVGAAHGLHWLFYVMVIAVPMTGWIMSSASPYPLEWFGLFPIPKWAVSKGSPIADAAHEAHEIMGLLFIPLILLHVGAALHHHFMLKNDVVRRML